MNSFNKVFGVIVRGRTYLNLLYLLLSFPLGLFYFIFLVSGLAIGISTIIIWVGLLFLLGVFAVWYGLIVFERQLAIWLLNEDIPPIVRGVTPGQTTWQRFLSALKNPVTWKGLLYLFAKFPLGVFSFVMLVTLLSVSLALLTMPFYYAWSNPHVLLNGIPNLVVDTLGEALVASLIGLLLTFVSLHILNSLAWVSGKFAKVMLGSDNITVPLSALELPSMEAPAAVG